MPFAKTADMLQAHCTSPVLRVLIAEENCSCLPSHASCVKEICPTTYGTASLVSDVNTRCWYPVHSFHWKILERHRSPVVVFIRKYESKSARQEIVQLFQGTRIKETFFAEAKDGFTGNDDLELFSRTT